MSQSEEDQSSMYAGLVTDRDTGEQRIFLRFTDDPNDKVLDLRSARTLLGVLAGLIQAVEMNNGPAHTTYRAGKTGLGE